jgi:UrcA family protein
MFARSRSRTIFPAALLAAVVATCAQFSAWAGEPQDTSQGEYRTAKVHYGDLDLTTPAGVVRFDQRIAAAVRDVCRPEDRRRANAASLEMECRAKAREQAFAQRELKVQQARAGALPPAGGGASRIEFGIN